MRITNRTSLVTVSAAAAFALAAFAGAAAAQNIVANFAGLSLGDTRPLSGNYAPPDTDGAIGPGHFVEFINGGYAVYNRNGTLAASAISDATFWQNAGISSTVLSAGLSDTRIKYDTQSGRWFAAEITVSDTSNAVLLAVSKTSNPLDGWTATSYVAPGSARFLDYPTLSVDANAVYIGTNDFSSSTGSFVGATLSSIPKTSLLAPAPTTAGMSTFSQSGTPSMGFTPQVPTNTATGYTGSAIVAMNASTYNRVQVTPINNTASASATLGSASAVVVANDGDPTWARQPDGTRNIDTIDNRFSGTIYQVGDKIYAANAFNPGVKSGGTTPTAAGYSAIHWVVLDANSGTLLQEGLISDPANDLWQPSIAANANGDVVIGYNMSGLGTNISAFAAIGHTVNGSLSFSDQVLLKTSPVNNYTDGFSSTTPDRWGDFSATMVDPTTPNTFWTIQEVAVDSTTWGTQISAIAVAVPEPQAYALMIVGLGFVAGLARRRANDSR